MLPEFVVIPDLRACDRCRGSWASVIASIVPRLHVIRGTAGDRSRFVEVETIRAPESVPQSPLPFHELTHHPGYHLLGSFAGGRAFGARVLRRSGGSVRRRTMRSTIG